jgi:prolycopene isomerase
VVKLSATARTAARFTLNHAGAMLGWEMSPEQLGDGRPGIRGPIDDLYLVGHWTRPGGGITPVIVSALHAAGAVLGATDDGAAPAFAPREGFAHGN